MTLRVGQKNIRAMQPKAADEKTVRAWLLEIRARNIVWAEYIHTLTHAGLVRYDTTQERYVPTVKGEKFLATTGG